MKNKTEKVKVQAIYCETCTYSTLSLKTSVHLHCKSAFKFSVC